jgi:aminoglycoside/choline kinase family phosphotransferase
MAATDASTKDDRSRAAELLAKAISAHWPGARAGELVEVPGDASSRRYLRCSLTRPGTRNGEDLKWPDSLVVMLMEDAAVAMSSDELGAYGEKGPHELPFLNIARFLSKHTSALPEIYAVADDDTALVLEDVGDVPLWEAAQKGDCELLFARALETLAAIQTSAIDDGSGCFCFTLAFDEKLFGWEFGHFLEYGVKDPAAPSMPACREELEQAARRLGTLPRVFCHRDYHAWNIHVQAGARIRIIDFQDALMGPYLYDVASLLTDRTTPDLITAEREQRLLAVYAAALKQASTHSPYTDDESLERDYCLCVLQRALKVIGRFNYLAEIKGKTAYARFLPWEIATARRAARRLSDMEAVQATLADNVRGD